MLPPPVQSFFDAHNRPDPRLLDPVFAPGFVGHVNGRDARGPAAGRQMVADLLRDFPGCAVAVLDGVREGDRVAVRWELAAKGAKPRGGLTLFRLDPAHARIAELWSQWDAP